MSPRARLGGAAGTVAAVSGWILLVGRTSLPAAAAAHAGAQVHGLLVHPGLWGALLGSTLHIQWSQACPYCREAVGVLGWLDTTLPNLYYPSAGLVLLAAFFASRVPAPLDARRRMAAAGLVVAAVVAVFALQYLSWSPIGSGTIEGVQGRYFLPLVPFLGLALPHGRLRLPSGAMVILCFYPALSIVITLRAIVFRYYL